MIALFAELRKRKVFHVAVVYAVVAWLIAQITVVIDEPLRLPAWFDAGIIVLLIAGFPVALVLAWAFELTPEGVRKTHAPTGEAAASRWLNEMQRQSTSPEIAARMFRAIHAIDVTALAPRVSVPTLVVHARQDSGVPFEVGREMASLIPGARFVGVESENHVLLEREPAYARFRDEAFAFLAGA